MHVLYSCVRMCASPIFMHVHALFLRTRPCSSVHMDVGSNMQMHAETLHTHMQVYVCMLAFKNLNFHYLDYLLPIFLSNNNSYVLLPSFCRSCPIS